MPMGINATSAARLACLGVLASALAGCAAGGGAPGDAFAQAGGGATVAFESIDGPPPQVFDRMVSLLDSESRLRNVSVVSRQGSAAYRVRGYLAAQVRGGRTSIAWVWDVYDRDQQRALRLSGEEPTGSAGRGHSGRDAWASADDLALRRIAQAGLSGLGGIINGTPAEPQPAPPSGAGPAIAGAGAPLASPTRTADAGGGVTALGFDAR